MVTQTNGRRVPTHPEGLRREYERMVRAAGARSRFIRTHSAQIHLVEAGEGPAIVHLHGNNTSSLSHLMLLQHMNGVRSFLVDRPGYGLSDPDEFPRDTFRNSAVQFVDDVLDELGLESAVLAGASGGGIWAIWYALARPERVGGLVMLGSVPLLPGARIPLGIRLMATPVLGTLLSRAMKPSRPMMVRLMSSVGEGDTILRHPDLLNSLVDAARDPVAAAANVAEFQALLSPLGTASCDPHPAGRASPTSRPHPDDLGRPRPCRGSRGRARSGQPDPGRPARGAPSGTRAPAREPAARRSAAAGLHSISSVARVSCSKAALHAHTPTVSKMVNGVPLPTSAAARAQTGQPVDGHA